MGQGLSTALLTVIQVVLPVLGLDFAQWRRQGRMHLLVRNHVGASVVMQLMDHSRAPDNDREDTQGQDIQAQVPCSNDDGGRADMQAEAAGPFLVPGRRHVHLDVYHSPLISGDF